MEKENLIIIGSSGHAKVIIDIFEKTKSYNIVGLIDDFKEIGKRVSGYPILGSIDNLKDIFDQKKVNTVFVAIGDNWSRAEVVEKILSMNANLNYPNAIHPSSIIGSHVKLGKGIALMANSIVNSGSQISDFCYVNTKASADHDVYMKEFSSLAPNATLGGNVILGKFSSVLISASVKEKITIGDHSLIGGGSLLLNNCSDYSIMFGTPAKFVRNRTKEEKYL